MGDFKVVFMGNVGQLYTPFFHSLVMKGYRPQNQLKQPSKPNTANLDHHVFAKTL
jgi:hypothetical protein